MCRRACRGRCGLRGLGLVAEGRSRIRPPGISRVGLFLARRELRQDQVPHPFRQGFSVAGISQPGSELLGLLAAAAPLLGELGGRAQQNFLLQAVSGHHISTGRDGRDVHQGVMELRLRALEVLHVTADGLANDGSGSALAIPSEPRLPAERLFFGLFSTTPKNAEFRALFDFARTPTKKQVVCVCIRGWLEFGIPFVSCRFLNIKIKVNKFFDRKYPLFIILCGLYFWFRIWRYVYSSIDSNSCLDSP